MKIAIVGRKADTVNYENYISALSAIPVTTLNPGEITTCQALILPGGGDITPAFFGERNQGSRNIDTELDILQFQAFDYAMKRRLPILGICKGMQVINVALGGTIVQHMPNASLHTYQGEDQYHPTQLLKHSCLYKLYGKSAIVNSAHHQCIKRLGNGLRPIQWCTIDHCVEAIVHESKPVLGLQWHPERLNSSLTKVSGKAILSLLTSWIDDGYA
ncbi:MAG: gamma-glutamyl-gamma-aminobutyrate hydrolase family protein [Lachnospiraceae bacterium]|nr:gamma-glutamyl-gamma-aminobutyrate hydrolase family protein [Lachnospiraceae bacterium]